jgi:hypothetical protein
MAKRILNPEQICEIKAAAALRRTLLNKTLANKYGVSPCTIKNVLNDAMYQRKLARKRKQSDLAKSS